jgi:hypothetical protein
VQDEKRGADPDLLPERPAVALRGYIADGRGLPLVSTATSVFLPISCAVAQPAGCAYRSAASGLAGCGRPCRYQAIRSPSARALSSAPGAPLPTTTPCVRVVRLAVVMAPWAGVRRSPWGLDGCDRTGLEESRWRRDPSSRTRVPVPGKSASMAFHHPVDSPTCPWVAPAADPVPRQPTAQAGSSRATYRSLDPVTGLPHGREGRHSWQPHWRTRRGESRRRSWRRQPTVFEAFGKGRLWRLGAISRTWHSATHRSSKEARSPPARFQKAV